MSQEIITHEQTQAPAVFNQQRQLGQSVNKGAIAIEQDRAIAEAQGQLVLAKKFPRDENKAYDRLMKSCALPALAAVAFYNVPRAGGTVSGPSIRLAEEIARCYGNFEYGHRELSRDHEKSEVEVYAWDKEHNNYSKRQLTVMHVRDTKNGPQKLRDQKDIDDKIANVASKQVRGRILALMPKWMVESAIEACRATIAGKNDEPVESRVRKMVQAFGKFGVTPEMLERFLNHKLDQITIDELVDLTGIYNSIKEGTAPSEFFAAAEQAEEIEKSAAAITAAAKSGATKAANQQAGGKSDNAGKKGKPDEKSSNVKQETPADNPVEEEPAQQEEHQAPEAQNKEDGEDLF